MHYDGPDLARVAELTGLDEADVVARHTGGTTAAVSAASPRLRVPAPVSTRACTCPAATTRGRRCRRVGRLADEFTAVYPRESPGGWQLIGSTDIALWDADRDPPALLAPGTPVRFVDAGAGS